MSAKEKANLARIRDNQRRSRSRRKEYLTELEARLRQCELQGIEASSEIQVAARRVADENRRLRVLLAQHGVSDDSIETHLQSSIGTDTMMDAPYGRTSATVETLNQLLKMRKACCADGSTPLTMGTNIATGSDSGSASTVQTGWEQNFTQDPSGRRRSDALHTSNKVPISAQPYMTPSVSTASQTSSMSGQGRSRSLTALHHIAPLQMPRNPDHHQISSMNQPMFSFLENQKSLIPPSHGHPSANDVSQQFHLVAPSGQRSSMYTPTSQTNMNSCGYATDMITTMAGVDPALIRNDLGCTGMDPSMECEVDNHIIFNVMDRYSGSVGM